MNIITKADVEKFKTLLKEGLKNGKQKDLTIYTSENSEKNEYFVSLNFKFFINKDKLDDLFNDDLSLVDIRNN